MTVKRRIETAKAMFADGKGMLAMDENDATCSKRFSAQGIPQMEKRRHDYRDMIVTTRGLSDCISGMIVDE
ncbi:class I fructose-bisphosphate aldolase [Rubripirellula reticaptiva]|uniref:fructose-bisphosphate aldolase n=1 Tax=Rubripirellula reticaptiva TaxID=2528013 RepID=A0A5C6ECW0_9BACT|nr:class I fructose-bisphosphate aldolase [Rubripirellula reticaptiva]TWU46852.1 Fructose-bisphosphate aldolase class-I [Rubripirellula reticaptiva]